MPPSHPVARFWSLVDQGLANLGINFKLTAPPPPPFSSFPSSPFFASDSNKRPDGAIDPHPTDALATLLRNAGFVRVTARRFHLPVGGWWPLPCPESCPSYGEAYAESERLRTVGAVWKEVLVEGLQAIALGPLMRGLGWDRRELEMFLVEVRRGYEDAGICMMMPFVSVYGQKPA